MTAYFAIDDDDVTIIAGLLNFFMSLTTSQNTIHIPH